MSAALHILGIRHHGPGSARSVLAALEHLRPDCILLEGPPDAADLLSFAAGPEMVPPVALLLYDPESPGDAAYYPFAVFSPEWQTIRHALREKSELRFFDLPFANRTGGRAKGEADGSPEEPADAPSGEEVAVSPGLAANPALSLPPDPLDLLAHAAGYADGEQWWERLIEERRGDADPLAVFIAVTEAMASLRGAHAGPPRDADEPAREAHMRRSIRRAQKEGFERIVVVCGAWHAPVLTAEALKALPAKSDDALLKDLPKRKVASTWVPWTHGRLTFASGYGAGVHSPGWYAHLWEHHDHIPERWLTKVARTLRDEGLDCSPGHIIEATRLAHALSAVRGRHIVGLGELTEATLSVILGGNPVPLALLQRRCIVGEALGEVPADAPAVPLQRDLTKLQTSLRMKPSADDKALDLDLRKDNDLARSHLLHRLTLLGVPWGKRQHVSTTTSTFHEIWKVQWAPELSLRVIEASRFGTTVESAAAGAVVDAAAATSDLPRLTAMLDDVLLADLPAAAGRLIARLQDVSAVASDIGHLMEALPPLARTLRYGNVRKTDAAMVEPLAAGLIARICAGLVPACAHIDDEAAQQMAERIRGVNGALATLTNDAFTEPWRERLRVLGGSETAHPLLRGLAWRILFDAAGAGSPAQGESGTGGTSESHDAAALRHLHLALSPGADPAAGAAWVEGFFAGSGILLVHDPRLLGIVDEWLTSLSSDAFESSLPLIRRTFATFEAPERAQIAQAVKRQRHAGSTPGLRTNDDAAADDYNPARGELVTPILNLLLSEATQ